MSTEVTVARSKQYGQRVLMLAQQENSRLMGTTMEDTLRGKEGYYDQVGVRTANKVTERHGDTPITDTPHDRRRVIGNEFDQADLIDRKDMVDTIVELSNPYLQAQAMAHGRAIDQEIITAADGDAFTGEEGATTTVFDTSNEVAVTVGGGGSDTGLNVEKLLAAKEILDANEAGDEERYCVVNAKQLRNLLNQTEVKSADFNTVRALVAGDIDTFLGFKFKRTELIGTDSNSDHKVLFWQKTGMLMARQAGMISRITERQDKRFSVQVYTSQIFGVTRMEENKVGRILCDPT